MSVEQMLTSKAFTKYLSIPNEIKSMPYGTTGYRMRYESLDGISLRMGIVAALRSLSKKRVVGLMITASHNPECDNGIKIIDPNGEMLPSEWENIAMDIVQWETSEFAVKLFSKCQQLNIELNSQYKGKVFIGGDTRSSSRHLYELVHLALTTIGCESVFFEFVTTPQLHFFVKISNETGINDINQLSAFYFERLSKAFCKNKTPKSQSTILNIDCANGVGAQHLLTLSHLVSDHLTIQLYNTALENLNLNCGADHVKINQCVPIIHNGKGEEFVADSRWCTIDGDADRLLYFYVSATDGFQLLDGDKMAVLIADYLSTLLREQLNYNTFTMAIVQTAYANYASTQYIERVLKISTKCVPTGVKHLHKAAQEFDIGIYFEANGHGTVLFSQRLRQYCTTLSDDHELRRLIDLINEADGDAISDILVIEHVLHMRDWSLCQWSSMYTDYPSRQLKVAVKDRNAIVTMDAERKVQSPSTLQAAIDNAVEAQLTSGSNHSRAFVRPSGTEDIVRVYCESSTQSLADELADKIASVIKNTLCS